MSPKVELIDYTGKGAPDPSRYAAALLLFAKETRLDFAPDRLEELARAPAATLEQAVWESANTIRSSWEFLDVTFLIRGLTRSIAQQVTRTRTGSYAMQSMRVADMSDAEVANPYPQGTSSHHKFHQTSSLALATYKDLVREGSPREDARGILPLHTKTNLIAKYNLRAFAALNASRASLRTSNEYKAIIAQMHAAVLDVWPWAELFFRRRHEAALALLEEVVREYGLNVGSGPGWTIAKAMDMIRGEGE